VTDSVFATGATGIVGRGVVDALLKKGAKVIAGIRDPAGAEHLPDGVEARTFNFGACAEELEDVLEGADRLFLMRPPQIADVQSQLFPVLDAAKRRGIRQTVFLSLQGVQQNTATPHHAVEEYMRHIDVQKMIYRVVRLNISAIPNRAIRRLTGTPATTFAEFVRDNRSAWTPQR